VLEVYSYLLDDCGALVISVERGEERGVSLEIGAGVHKTLGNGGGGGGGDGGRADTECSAGTQRGPQRTAARDVGMLSLLRSGFSVQGVGFRV